MRPGMQEVNGNRKGMSSALVQEILLHRKYIIFNVLLIENAITIFRIVILHMSQNLELDVSKCKLSYFL